MPKTGRLDSILYKVFPQNCRQLLACFWLVKWRRKLKSRLLTSTRRKRVNWPSWHSRLNLPVQILYLLLVWHIEHFPKNQQSSIVLLTTVSIIAASYMFIWLGLSSLIRLWSSRTFCWNRNSVFRWKRNSKHVFINVCTRKKFITNLPKMRYTKLLC